LTGNGRQSTGFGRQYLIDRVHDTLSTMKDRDVEVLKLRYFDRLTLKQIAEKHGTTYQAAQDCLTRAHANFKRAVARTTGVVTSTTGESGRPVRDRKAEDREATAVFQKWAGEARAMGGLDDPLDLDGYHDSLAVRHSVKRTTSKDYEGGNTDDSEGGQEFDLGAWSLGQADPESKWHTEPEVDQLPAKHPDYH
jgi:hypothetical protein